MKRVLIITYYWPPSGGSGVQRWLKMSKYLPEFGWQPVIYTAKDAEYPVEDVSLEKDISPYAEVIRRPIVEPYSFYKKFLGKKKDDKIKAGFIDESNGKKSWKEKLSIWIRGNFFIPDARCWWIKPSARFLLKYLKEHPVDAIISTGPPHSMHLIALKLHKKTNIPWIADFRDPWTGIYYFDSLRLSSWAKKKHRRLEKKVLTKANQVVAVSWHEAKEFTENGAANVKVITNGFDENVANNSILPPNDKFVISHIGIIPPKASTLIWNALGELAKENESFKKDFELHLIGHIDYSVLEILKTEGINDNVKTIPYITHNQVIEEQNKSHVLLVLIPVANNSQGIVTGKLFECLVAQRFILNIGPENGDAAAIINETGSGVTIDFDDKEKMKTQIIELYRRFLDGKMGINDNKSIEKYSRRNLAEKYAKLLNKNIL